MGVMVLQYTKVMQEFCINIMYMHIYVYTYVGVCVCTVFANTKGSVMFHVSGFRFHALSGDQKTSPGRGTNAPAVLLIRPRPQPGHVVEAGCW